MSDTYSFIHDPPPPENRKLSEILALLGLFSFRIPPPPNIEIWADLGTLRLFSFRILEYSFRIPTPPPPKT